MKIYDAIIIWAWWWTKLRPLIEKWKKIAIIEKDKLWWTCLNRWCIPSKMLIHSADVANIIKEADRFHIKTEKKFDIDFEKIIKETNETIWKDSAWIEKFYEKLEWLDYYAWEAHFIEDKVIEINWEKITAEKIIIATWARPMVPEIKWLKNTPFMTSTQALNPEEKPESLIVIWWWYIATELWHFYAQMWIKTTFIVRWKMLKNEDNDVIEEFTKAFTKKYDVISWKSPIEVEYKDKTFKVKLQDKNWEITEIEAKWLLVAVWVTPNSDTLNLENTNIEIDKKWFIKVNDFLETNVKWIYSLWDAIWRYLFRHSVNFEGEYLLENLYKDNPEKIDYPPVPHSVFSYPQVWWVWLTQKEADEKGIDYVIWFNKYSSSAMGQALKSEYWFVKLLFEKKTRKLIWWHIIWDEASNMIHMIIAYITMNASLDDMLRTIYVHPALPENIRNACRNAKSKLDSAEDIAKDEA